MEREGEKTDWTERKIRNFWRHRGGGQTCDVGAGNTVTKITS